MANSELKAARLRTKQVLAQSRNELLAEARSIVERTGDAQSILVARLAKSHGVAPMTASRWLEEAGFNLVPRGRGRPTLHELTAHDGGVEGE